VAAGVPRREGARGVEVRRGGEQRAWCGEAETGVHCIGVGRRSGEGRRSAKRRLEVHYQGISYSKGRRRGSDDSWGN
jgi:hypothetical protein